MPVIPPAVPSPEASEATCGQRAVRAWSWEVCLPGAEGKLAGRRGQCCHLVGISCDFSWLPGRALSDRVWMGDMSGLLNLGM